MIFYKTLLTFCRNSAIIQSFDHSFLFREVIHALTERQSTAAHWPEAAALGIALT
jgi:hypothetical protein